MICLALNPGDNGNTLFVLGFTDLDVAKLTRGTPVHADLRELGGHGEVVVVHGATVADLGAVLSTGMPASELPKLTAALDQVGAEERDAA
jgi:hypothetical protein